MGSIQSITSKSDLMSKAIELQTLANDLNERVNSLQGTLGSVKNYDNIINISDTANFLANNFNNISDSINMTVFNIKNYISDVVEFDKFDLKIDDKLNR